jgi:hypothetical protein
MMLKRVEVGSGGSGGRFGEACCVGFGGLVKGLVEGVKEFEWCWGGGLVGLGRCVGGLEVVAVALAGGDGRVWFVWWMYCWKLATRLRVAVSLMRWRRPRCGGSVAGCVCVVCCCCCWCC